MSEAQKQPSFFDLYKAIVKNPNLKPYQRTEQERQLVADWGGEQIKAMCVSLLNHPKYAILDTPDAVFVTKYRDVLEVFDRNDVFSVSGYGERMAITTGAFMLGMQESVSYQHDHSVVRLSQPLSDMTSIRQWVRNYSEKCVAGLTKGRTSLDVVADVAYSVPVAFAGHYYGVPGPEQKIFLGWLEWLAAYIFNWNAGPMTTEASRAGLALQTYLDGLIAQRKAEITANKWVPDNVMTRMIRAQVAPNNSLDDVGIRRNLGGLMIGCTMPPCGTIAFALDEIMNLNDPTHLHYDPDAYATIIKAAQDDDIALLERCMLEAARLGSPEPPSLFRTALEDYTLAKGTDREKTVRKGQIVVAVPSSAMMDPDIVESPTSFRIDRPMWTYVMFGQGQHECLGRRIGTVLLAEAARPVLALQNLRRASGAAGQLSTGTQPPFSFYPAHMTFEFEQSPDTN